METSTVSTEQIEARARQIVEQSCQKHHKPVETVSEAQWADARRAAAEQLEERAQLEQNPYFRLYTEEKAAHAATRTQLEIVKTNRSNSATSAKAAISVEQARGRMGNQWFLSTDAQKLQALGIDPNSINREELRRLFGRNASSHDAVDHQRSNPQRHATLREAAKALGIYGG
jgi:hypothetical protein